MPSENDLNQRLARFNHETVELETIVEDYIKLLRVLVEALKQELVVNVPGGKVREVSELVVKKLKDLTAALNSATDCQIRLDKGAKDRAKRMSDDERTEAAIRWVLKFEYARRRDTLLRLVAAHNKDTQEKKRAGVLGATLLSQVDIT
jgi:hypothetical protein